MATFRSCAALLVSALVSSACGSDVRQPAPARTPTGGIIAGRVTLRGRAPAVEPLRMGFVPECMELAGSNPTSDTAVVANDGAIANVFVYIEDGLAPTATFPEPTHAAVLDQRGCRFVPHVLGVQVGQTLELTNSDPIEHDVHGLAGLNAEFNRDQPEQGMRETHTFSTPEVMVRLKCDRHPWMSAYVGVVRHPYFAVSDAEGRFTLTDVPDGTYTVAIWHERFGTGTARVTVAARRTATADFVMKGD